jgi:predicted TIM-barrel fold metal-dependent hydrolase
MMWREHLQECVEVYGTRGIKLHPYYHKYNLLEDQAAEVMAEARSYGLLVYVQTSLLDVRHHPGYCLVPEVPISEVAQAAERCAESRFIVGGAKHFRSRTAELFGSTVSRNCHVVTDGLGGPFDGIGGLADRVGSARLLFGTRMPLLHAEAARAVVEQSVLSDEDKEKILGTNAAELLGLLD